MRALKAHAHICCCNVKHTYVYVVAEYTYKRLVYVSLNGCRRT